MINVPIELRKQLNFILASCRGYDEGRYEEAIRIAVSIRVLFHNTPNSKGLIGGHYEGKDLKLLSTTNYKANDPKNKESHYFGFIGPMLNPSIFKPYLDDGPRKEPIPWKEWWEAETILPLKDHESHLKRKRIVTTCANTDGGAHIDQKKKEDYKRLEGGIGTEVGVSSTPNGPIRRIKIQYANLAILRQIGHEILHSSDLLELANNT